VSGPLEDKVQRVCFSAGTERELMMMRWGMPPPPRAGGYSGRAQAVAAYSTIASTQLAPILDQKP